MDFYRNKMEIEKEGKSREKKIKLKRKKSGEYFGILSFFYNFNLVLIPGKHLKLLLYN